MLQKIKIGETYYNDVPSSLYDKIPAMPSKVKVRLHPSKFVAKKVMRVEKGDAAAPVLDIRTRVLCGEYEIALTAEVSDSSGEYPQMKTIAVISAGKIHHLIFPRNLGIVELYSNNALHKQIYLWLMVWPECKNSINHQKGNPDFYCEMIDEGAAMAADVKVNDAQTDARMVIKETKDLEFLYNLACSIKYNGEKSENEIKLYLNSIAQSDPHGVIRAFNAPDMVRLRMLIVQGFSERVLEYKPRTGKVGFVGDSGRDLVDSDPNEDFNNRISKLMIYFGQAGNESDMIMLKSRAEKRTNDTIAAITGSQKRTGGFQKKTETSFLGEDPGTLLPSESDTFNMVSQPKPLLPMEL